MTTLTWLMWVGGVLLGFLLVLVAWREIDGWLARRWWRRTVSNWRKEADEAMNGAYRREQARRYKE